LKKAEDLEYLVMTITATPKYNVSEHNSVWLCINWETHLNIGIQIWF